MLDLAAHHARLRGDLERAVARVIASNRFILGEEVAGLERELAVALGLDHAVGISSGTDALLALLMAAGVGPGDEVVTTPYSFFATVEAVVRLGARPVFGDIDPETLNLDPDRAAERIGPRTKAVVVVHIFGRMSGTARLAKACAEAGIPLIEDAAQAIGASDTEGGARRMAGAIGMGAALSFFPSKNLGGFGDGGMVITDEAPVASQIRLLRNHGATAKLKHDVVGGNFRLDELQAALLRLKVPSLNRWSDERRRIAAGYLEQLAGCPVRLPPWDAGCVWNQFVIGVPEDRRAKLIEHLEQRKIASAIYYPIPLHLQPALAQFGYRLGDFPRAERASRETLALPIFPELGDARLTRVADAVAGFYR
jgi:dTDP-4-amino-4,6-dideoxygalactose transaminase